MTIQQKLQIIQQVSGLTQTEIAVVLGVSFPTLNSWINGKSQPRQSKINKIEALYREATDKTASEETPAIAKKAIIEQKRNTNKNLLKEIKNRPDLFDQIALSFTYHTNSIEGSTLSENETAAILFDNRTFSNKSLTEHLEAKNHESALRYLFNKISSDLIITEELIVRLHEILLNGIRDDAGLYRRHSVRIVGANVPTANYLKIPVLMQEVIMMCNESTKDVIQQAATTHAIFEKIHPFADGNCRIGRLLMAAILLRSGYAPAIIKQKRKRECHKYLQRAQQKAQQKEEYEQLDEFITDAVLYGYLILGK